MASIHMVIGNAGDGSNFIHWVSDPAVLARMQEMADEGDEAYASGDGLQARELKFPLGFDVRAWAESNHLSIFEMDDFD
jgi:hypothetical protein